MKRIRWLFLLLLLAALPLSIVLVKQTAENRGKAIDLTSKLELSPSHVWYWGWDSCNCAPETGKCTSGYHAGENCADAAKGSFPYGPFGGYRFSWGYPSVAGLEEYLNQAQKLKIGVENFSKPIWLSGPILTDSQGNVYGVGDQYSTLICADGTEKKVAIYQNQIGNYSKWIAELAVRLKNHPNLTAITITHGLDGEARCKPDNCQPAAGQPDPCAGYENYRTAVTDAFYKSFCNGSFDQTTGSCLGTIKPLFVQTDSWMDAAGKLGQRQPPLGIKFSGFVADTVGILYGKARGWGLVEAFARYRNLIPTAVEPKYGNWFLAGVPGEQTGQGTYWWNLEALWLRPTLIDMNPAYGLWGQVTDDPDYFELINSHLNVTAQTTPDVWIAFRDTPQLCGAATAADFEGNPCVGKSDGQSGKRGDYDFFLTRPDGLPGNKTVVLTRPEVYKSVFANPLEIEPLKLYNQEIPQNLRPHKYSRHLRRTDKATGNFYMSFDVDNDYPWANKTGQGFEATINFLDLGSGSFYLEYKNSSGQLVKKEITRTNSSTWKKAVLTLNDAYFNDNLEGLTDFRIYNGGAVGPDVYLHLVKIKGLGTRPTEIKRRTYVTCSLPNESIVLGENPLLEALLTDGTGQPLAGKNIRIAIDPFWYSNRISYGQTDTTGVARKNLDLTGLPPLFQEARSAHEVAVVFPGDSQFYASSTVCLFPLNLKRSDFQPRRLTASLSKTEVNIGDEVTVNVNLPGGGKFSVEGVGFGMPACEGTADANGHGSCSFKIGGMALGGRQTLGVIAAWNSPGAAVSVHLPIKVLGEAPEPTPPPGKAIALLVKLKGVDAMPSAAAVENLNFKVKFVNKVNNQEVIPAKTSFTIMPDSASRYWILAVWGSDVPAAGTYHIYIKGPKHIQRKFADISLSGTTQTIDLTGKGDLPPGDLPNASGVQDGVVNSLDAVYLTGCFAHPQESACLKRADLDFDDTITTRDMELINSTFISQRWEDE